MFCCTGCRSVYEILQNHDLCGYYQVEQRPGLSQAEASRDTNRFEILNQSQVRSRFIEWADGSTIRLRFEVPSMHCASCIWLLDKLHRFNEGILRSEVDFMRKTVRVDINTTRILPSEVGDLLSSLGYEPLLTTEGSEIAADEERRKQRRSLYLRLGVAGFAAGNVMMISAAQYLAADTGVDPTLKLVFDILGIGLSLPVLFFSASPWFKSALGAIKQRTINLDVPVAIGISALFIRSVVDIAMGTGEGFLDSFAGLVFFLLIGRLFQQRAFDAVSFDRTYRSFFPLSVRREKKGIEEVVAISEIAEGDVLSIKNGEVVPCDSVLLSNAAYVDYAFVTGEAVPVECTQGALIHAGGRIVGTAGRLTAIKPTSQSYLTGLWERSGVKKSRNTYLDMSDTFGKWFTIGAVGLAISGFLFWLPDWQMGLSVFTAVLIIACPCALTMAAPVTLGTAVGRLSRRGIFAKASTTITELDNIDDIVFDKTGTLTTPRHSTRLNPIHDSNNAAEFVAALASNSSHPVSASIRDEAGGLTASEVREYVGRGIEGIVNNKHVAIGSAAFIESHIGSDIEEQPTASAYAAIDGTYVGALLTSPTLREGIDGILNGLSTRYQTWLLSGDNKRDMPLFAPLFKSDRLIFEASPEAKVDVLTRIGDTGKRVAMVGDGLNDAGAMNAANIAIGVSDGASTLVPACDVVMPASELKNLGSVLAYAHTMTLVIKTSLIFTVFYNMVGLSLALMGILTPVATAILMPVSSLAVIGISVAGARWFARDAAWE